MKTLKEQLLEACAEDYDMLKHHKEMMAKENGETCEDEENIEDLDIDVNPDEEDIEIDIDEGEVSSEEDFREYAENKFKEVFGDKLDTDRMNSTIDGILSDYKEAADKGDWGELVGVLNKSFGS